MELERRIYSPWAFTKNEEEKAKINYSIYKELKDKYKICVYSFKKPENVSDYDVILFHKSCYLHSETIIIKNEPNLSTEELALLTDGGNLCFGWSFNGYCIRVSED